jgi:long-chain acyl-CoA synthetase
MTRIAVILVAAFLALTADLAGATEVAGVRVDDQAKSGNANLVLNGAGLRKKLFFRVYVAALYLPKKTTNAGEIIDSRDPRRITLHLVRDLDADSLIGALKEGLQQNHSESELAALKADIERFEGIMRGVGNAKIGDVVGIDFSGDATMVSFNGQARGSIPGFAFGRALLKVWLGDKPADADLKRALLGG